MESAWILTNIASFENFAYVEAIFDAGIERYIIPMLSHPDPNLYDQCLWLIANLIGSVNNDEDEKKIMQVKLFNKFQQKRSLLLKKEKFVLKIFIYII